MQIQCSDNVMSLKVKRETGKEIMLAKILQRLYCESTDINLDTLHEWTKTTSMNGRKQDKKTFTDSREEEKYTVLLSDNYTVSNVEL